MLRCWGQQSVPYVSQFDLVTLWLACIMLLPAAWRHVAASSFHPPSSLLYIKEEERFCTGLPLYYTDNNFKITMHQPYHWGPCYGLVLLV